MPTVLATLESAPPPYAPMAYPPMANPSAECAATSLSSNLARRTLTTRFGNMDPSRLLPPRTVPSVLLHAHVHVLSILTRASLLSLASCALSLHARARAGLVWKC
eukprot:CAMPEP_0113920660 /NCGR_PEP_ID=MMETSP1159-20121227/667_1 /TAXON_ID=88271 /ORGANISM="Picocystis salinarum" /LENGTH=104 /DNA_ID=CAMNT_0000920655 /DNA_START=451 /DNA_END=762 /DNA_ORIENTATION=- /assembly_acc=CAM_ASM_000767